MPISDEKVDAILETLAKTMEQMCASQKESSEMQKDLLNALMKSQTGPREMHSGVKTEHDGGHEERKRWAPGRPKAIRPIIEEGVDDFGWNLFLDKWERFKQVASLTEEHEVILELRDSCSDQVNRMLFEFIGTAELNRPDLTEEKLLEHIKTVAVRTIHKEVHRWHFTQINQGDSEKVTKFVGRLKAQAVLCDYNAKCECGKRVSYADEMVSQRLLAGAMNPEHQSKVIGEANELVTLKDKVDKMISLETTDEASSKIRAPLTSHSNPIKTSQYRRNQKQKLVAEVKKPTGGDDSDRIPAARGRSQRPNGRQRRCRGCGRSNHPNGKSMARSECPAWGSICRSCKRANHFEKVCERRSKSSFAGGDTSGSEEDFLLTFYFLEVSGFKSFEDLVISVLWVGYRVIH